MQDYDTIINNLFARHQSVQNAGFTSDSYKPGLDRIWDLDRRMGRPSERLRCCGRDPFRIREHYARIRN